MSQSNSNSKKTFLQVPLNRRSVQVINELKEKNISKLKLGSHIYSEESKKQFPVWEEAKSELNSSLELLDLGKCKAFGEDTMTKVNENSLPFNPAEITARSTAVFPEDNSRENADAYFEIEKIINAAKMQSQEVDDLLSTSKFPEAQKMRQSLSSYRNSIASCYNVEKNNKYTAVFSGADDSKENADPYFQIEEIINAAKAQSQAVDDILSSSKHPEVQQMRESLSSYRNNFANSYIADNTTTSSRDGIMNFSINSKADKTDISESNFLPSNQVDLSNAELSWMQENGILPVKPQMNELESLSSMSKNTFTVDGEISLGQYFRQKNGEIKNMINGISPERLQQSTPLYSPGDVTRSCLKNKSPFGETFSKSSNTMTLNDSSGIPPITDESSIKFSSVGNKTAGNSMDLLTPCKDITNTTNFEVSTSNSLLSLTNIKNIVGQMSSEEPSDIIDRILQSNNRYFKKPSDSKETNKKSPRKNIDEQNCSLTPIGRSTFGKGSNIFHSTKHEDFLNTKNKNKSLSDQSNEFLSSNEKTSSGFVSTLKNIGKSNSGSSNFTESSIKSANTVIPCKTSNALKTISENKNLELSPLTQSDSSRELRDLMSPLSQSGYNDEKDSGHTPRRLINEFRFMNSNDDEGWITPTPTNVNEISKECIPADTPRRSDFLSKSDNTNNFSMRSNESDMEERIKNIPIKGNWIEILSTNATVLLGVTSHVNMNLVSLGNRWINVNMKLQSIYIDNKNCTNDINNIATINIPVSPVLLKADSNIPCSVQITMKTLSDNIKLHIGFNLTDVVTKSTFQMTHVLKIKSEIPKLQIQTPFSDIDSAVNFPIIPENNDMFLPIVVTNKHNVDLPIKLLIDFDKLGLFSISDISLISKSDIKNTLSEKLQLVQKNYDAENENTKKSVKGMKKEVSYVLTAETSAKVLLHLQAPKLKQSGGTSKIQTVSGNLNMYLATQAENIQLGNVSLSGKIGTYKLLLRNAQKSDTLTILPGNSELVELMNAGNMNMQYKLFIASYYNGNGDQSSNMAPCEDPIFRLDKSQIELIPGEKTAITVTYPENYVAMSDVKRSLVFESPYTTEIMQLVGSYTPRTNSQQSTYSVDSEATHSEEITIKATKKGLSWGCVKMGEMKSQDIVFKNPSTSRKLRVISTVIGDSFKIMSDNGLVTSLMFSLQPQECRSVRIGFKPTHCGGHSGALRVARRISPDSQKERADTSRLLHRASLYGVGDESLLIFKDGVFRHGTTQDLPLGSLNNNAATKLINFTVWNKGDAPGFFLFSIDLKWKYRSLQGEVTVIPDRGVIPAGESMKCAVIVPRRAVLLAKQSSGNTETLATLQVLHGNEATRLRIKKIRSEHLNDEEVLSAWADHSQGKLEALCSKFTGEDNKFGNVHLFKETIDALKILLDELVEKEVTVTYDVDLDSTVARLSTDLDETLQFQTMCADYTSSIIEPN